MATVLAYLVSTSRQRQDILSEFQLLTNSSILIEQRSSEDDVILDTLNYLEKSQIGDALISFFNARTGMIEAKHASCKRLEAIIPLTKRALTSNDILAHALRDRKPLFAANCDTDPRCDPEAIRISGIQNQFVLPLAFGTELIGTLQVDLGTRAQLSEEEQLILQALASSISMSISRIRNTARLLELSDQLMSSSRFLVAETLAGMTVHSVKHRLRNILADLNKDLEKKEVRERRELSDRLTSWRKTLQPLLEDAESALAIVKAQGEADAPLHTDIAKQIQPTINLWATLLQSAKCHIKADATRCQRSICTIGPPQIREIISVLIVNSVQAFSKAIEITLDNPAETLESPANNFIERPVRVTVEDDGIGLPRMDPEQLFLSTYTTKHERFGTGLGLFIGRGLARRAGGDLVAPEAQPTKGARFVLILPTYDADNEG